MHISRRHLVAIAPPRTGSRGTFAPTDLGGALVAWWNADDHDTANMTDDGDGLISAYVDRIGGLSLTAAAGARPTWGAAAFTGFDGTTKAALAFDGTANCLTGATTGLPTGTTPGEIWLVATGPAVADGSNRNPFTYGGTAGGTFRRFRKATTDNASASDGAVTANALSTTASWVGVPKIIGGMFGATTVEVRANGRAGTTATGATLNTGTTRTRIGADSANTAANFWLGAIRHVIVTTALTNAQRQQLEGWMAWDSGLVGL